MKVSRSTLWLVPFYIVYPLYALPGVLARTIRGDRLATVLLSVFMGTLAYLMIPYDSMDLVRYYHNYEYFNEQSYSFLELFVESPEHFLLNSLAIFLGKLYLPKEFLSFLFVTLCYYFPLQIYIDLCNKNYWTNPTKPNLIPYTLYCIVFLIIILGQIKYFGSASGLRNPLAIILSLYGIYTLYTEKRPLKGCLYIIVSPFLHISLIVIPIFLLLVEFFDHQRFYRFLFKLSMPILLLGLSSSTFFLIIGFVEPLLSAVGLYKPSYLDKDGIWGAGYWSNVPFKVFIFETYIKPLPFYAAFMYLFFEPFRPTKYRKLIYLLFVFVAILSISRTLFDRYSYLTLLLFIVMIMTEYRESYYTMWKKLFLVLFISCQLIVTFSTIYKYRHTFLPSWKKVLYLPMPIIFAQYEGTNEYNYLNRDFEKQ